MKKTEKFQTVKEVIDLIESIPKWQVEYRVRFVEGNDPNFYKHIWYGSIKEYKRVAPRSFNKLKVSSFKLLPPDLHTNFVEYSISIDTNYYGFNAEQLKQLFIAQSHNISAKERIDTVTAKLECTTKWADELSKKLGIDITSVLAVRDSLISLQTNEIANNAHRVTCKFMAERIDENKLEIEQNNKIIRAAEKIVNTLNKLKGEK